MKKIILSLFLGMVLIFGSSQYATAQEPCQYIGDNGRELTFQGNTFYIEDGADRYTISLRIYYNWCTGSYEYEITEVRIL